MDHFGIVKRAWRILWNYKVLWVFGVLTALTSGAGGGGGGNAGANFRGNGRGVKLPPRIQAQLEQWGRTLGRMFGRGFQGGIPAGPLVFITALMCLMLVYMVAATVARFVAETALIKLVDRYAAEELKLSIKEGFRVGWSREAWHLFLLRLVVMLPLSLIFMALVAVAVAPFLLWVTKSNILGVLGTATAIGLLFLVGLFGVVVFTVATVVLHLSARAVVLTDLGVLESLNAGARMAWKSLKDVGLMWLVMFVLRLGFTLLTIPVFVLALTLAVLVGGGALLAVRVLADVLFRAETAWVMGFLAGIPMFVVALSAPLVFVGGLWETFASTVWTLTYRELVAMGNACAPSSGAQGSSVGEV